MKRVLAMVGAVALLAVVSAAYFRVGWTRMEAACSTDPPGSSSSQSVEFSWSWDPAGFQCTYDDGRRRTSLWFS
jgi:hypothetical protein